jgi:YhcH/YjgK/YiaL family protein
MILDTLGHAFQYHGISPRFEDAFAFLRQVTDQTPLGRHEITGENVFALVQLYDTRSVEECEYESHRKYIDVQYIQRGCEVMYWAPLSLLTVGSMPYDAEKDAALYGRIPEGIPFRVRAGQFAIFFPEDGHIPSCNWDISAKVLKVVVKVRV